MIISDKYQLVFVHIPKCAGTTVRAPLQQFDDRDGFFTGRVDHHPDLGLLDYVHIPLFSLREYFPPEFEKVQSYWSFAVMRDPSARFASSVSQRLKMYLGRWIHKCSLDDIRGVIDESIDYLSSQPQEQHLLPPEYIHFQKQVDYIQVDGQRVLDTLYTMDEIGDLIADISHRVGDIVVEHSAAGGVIRANQTIAFRNDLLRSMVESVRPVTNRVGKLLPESAKQRIRDHIYVPRDKRMKDLFAADHVRVFINDYYANDIALYQQIKPRERSEGS